MTVFWGAGWGLGAVYRAAAVTGKPAALSMERQVKKKAGMGWEHVAGGTECK